MNQKRFFENPMKKSFAFFVACMFIISASAQSFKTVEKEFKFVQLPLKMLPGTVKTYNYEFEPGTINWASYPYDNESIYSFVRLEGYQYQKANSDITVSVSFSGITVNGYTEKKEQVGVSDMKYTAVYEVSVPTVIKITDNTNKVLDETTINDKINIVYPPANDQYGMPVTIKDEATLKATLTQKADFIDGYVKENAIHRAVYNVKNVINDSYSFIPVVKKYEIMSFKTKKDADFTAWDTNAQKLADAFGKLSTGTSPQEFDALVEPSIAFWKSELAKYESNMKENKQLVGAAGYNIVLASMFANKFDVVSEIAAKLKDHSWKYDEEFNSMVEYSNKLKQRADANTGKTVDYIALAQIPPLKINQVEALLTVKGGKPMDGVIEYNDPFYVKPYQNSVGITFIPRDAFLTSFGNIKGKDKKTYKPEEIEGYKVAGKEFVGTEYSDPTTLSLSGNKALLELVISGKAKLYKRYEKPSEEAGVQVVGVSVGESVYKTNMDSKANPSFIVSVGKKSVIIFNYSAFADLLKDCPTVVDKINKGEYGNAPIEQKTGKFAKMMSKGKTEKIDTKVIAAAITEYNSLMK